MLRMKGAGLKKRRYAEKRGIKRRRLNEESARMLIMSMKFYERCMLDIILTRRSRLYHSEIRSMKYALN